MNLLRLTHNFTVKLHLSNSRMSEILYLRQAPNLPNTGSAHVASTNLMTCFC